MRAHLKILFYGPKLGLLITCSGGERSEAAEFKHELPESRAEAGANKGVILTFVLLHFF